jgi:hypothetical protein
MKIRRFAVTAFAAAAMLAGAIGISGDGIDQDDLVSRSGALVTTWRALATRSGGEVISIEWQGLAGRAFQYDLLGRLILHIDAPEFGFDVSVQ